MIFARALSLQRIYPAVDDSDLTLGKVQQARDDSLEGEFIDTSLTEVLQLAKLPMPENNDSASPYEES